MNGGERGHYDQVKPRVELNRRSLDHRVIGGGRGQYELENLRVNRGGAGGHYKRIQGEMKRMSVWAGRLQNKSCKKGLGLVVDQYVRCHGNHGVIIII